MSLINELVKAIVTKYTTSGNTTPFYFNHAPQTEIYPIIIFDIIGTVRNLGMADTTHTAIYKYNDVRVQFSVYGNEQQMSEIITVSDQLEGLYDLNGALTLGDDSTHICTHMANQRIGYYNSEEKIYSITTDYIIKVGK